MKKLMKKMRYLTFRDVRENRCILKSTIVIHPSNELPLNDQQIVIGKGSSFDILITPEIVKSDEDLKLIDISIRHCYFENERKLKFFKIYTQKNCEIECISQIGKKFI